MQKYPSNIVEKFLEKDFKVGLIKFVEELSKSELISGKLNQITFKSNKYRTHKKQFWKLCCSKGLENCKRFLKNSTCFNNFEEYSEN